MDKMTNCPYCGSNDGLFSNESVAYQQYYKFSGEPNYCSEFHSTKRRKGTPLYCLCCEKRVTTLEKIQKLGDRNETD